MTLLEKINAEAREGYNAWSEAVRNGTATRALRDGERFDPLAAWCEATGRRRPGEPVAVECRVQVGGFKFRTTKPNLPNIVKMLNGAKGPARKPAKHPALVALAGPTAAGARGARKREHAQEAAYKRAMEAGQWAA